MRAWQTILSAQCARAPRVVTPGRPLPRLRVLRRPLGIEPLLRLDVRARPVTVSGQLPPRITANFRATHSPLNRRRSDCPSLFVRRNPVLNASPALNPAPTQGEVSKQIFIYPAFLNLFPI